jgi:hypothetical protein
MAATSTTPLSVESARTINGRGKFLMPEINLSGEYIAGLPAEMSPFPEEEVAMLASEAKRYGERMAAHARSSESVKMCVRHGIEMVYHASFADEEALDMLETNKDKHFVAPGIGWLIRPCFNASGYGITPELAATMGYKRELEVAADSIRPPSAALHLADDDGRCWMAASGKRCRLKCTRRGTGRCGTAPVKHS